MENILKEIANYINNRGYDANEDYIEDGFISMSDRVSPNIISGDRYVKLVDKIKNLASELRVSKWGNLIDIEFERNDEWYGFRVSLKRQMKIGGNVKSIEPMENKQYIKKVLSNETDFKKLWQLEKDVNSLDEKFGLGVSRIQFHIHSNKKELEVELNNNNQFWDREFNEIKRYNLSKYLDKFKKQDITYRDYKDELMDDLNEITDKFGEIGGYKVYGSIVERTTTESEIPLFLINPSNYEYAKSIANNYSERTLMKFGGSAKESVIKSNISKHEFGSYIVKYSKTNKTWQVFRGKELITDYAVKINAINYAKRQHYLNDYLNGMKPITDNKMADGGSVNTNDLKVGDVILFKTFYPITFETDYKQTTGKAYGKIVRISQYGNKSFIVQPNSRFKSDKVVERKNVLGIGTESDMFLTY